MDDKIQELISMVREMRNCQREYFRERSGRALQNAKLMEKQVDDWIREYEGKLYKQGSLI